MYFTIYMYIQYLLLIYFGFTNTWTPPHPLPLSKINYLKFKHTNMFLVPAGALTQYFDTVVMTVQCLFEKCGIFSQCSFIFCMNYYCMLCISVCMCVCVCFWSCICSCLIENQGQN